MKRRDCKIKTPDDWRPNYPNNEVELSIMQLNPKPVAYRVCVWGMDDLGMEKDFITPNPEEALKLYEQLEKKGSISIGELAELGFVSF